MNLSGDAQVAVRSSERSRGYAYNAIYKHVTRAPRKLGISDWVEVRFEQGLTNHSYRVLQP